MSIDKSKKNITDLISRLAQSAKGMIALGMVVTHAIACYVAIDILWSNYILKRVEKNPHKLMWEYVVRTAVVFTTCKFQSQVYCVR